MAAPGWIDCGARTRRKSGHRRRSNAHYRANVLNDANVAQDEPLQWAGGTDHDAPSTRLLTNGLARMQRSMISMGLAAVSLRDLALVQAVHRLGGFTAAARAMHISPSGLSHEIEKVEQALDVVLFERGGRGVLPTAAGQRLLAAIDGALAVAEEL